MTISDATTTTMGKDESDNEEEPDNGSDARHDERDHEDAHVKKKRKRKRKRNGNSKANEQKDGDRRNDDEASSSSSPSKKAATVNQSSNSESDVVSRTVYIEGLPYDATEDQVRDFFGDLAVTSLRLPKWQDTGRLRGYGHAEFATSKDYERSLALSGQCISGYSRYLQIRPAKPPKPVGGATTASSDAHSNATSSEPTKTVLLKNLSYEAVEDDIQSVMEAFGSITEGGIRIARHNRNKQSRGFAYVEYQRLESAIQAVKKAGGGGGGIVICHRPCLVDYDHGTVRKSFRTETGRLWQKRYGKSSFDA